MSITITLVDPLRELQGAQKDQGTLKQLGGSLQVLFLLLVLISFLLVLMSAGEGVQAAATPRP